ncbi:AraC family transcriptional regulator [Pseudomaricurvus sp. HS19]|uniref:AraC family transcriptional regulator n=1 Tax=Pseudomaricurvus sp. HS19 TaxID=2692626 RepID=UPI001369D90A|nr:AraC family transcriptional regulator [Pseudomaricurvus sp. HS19]MYM63058.1 helix-turn-helix domain-containing protein [Pseudomaricurvus sp. HS19]
MRESLPDHFAITLARVVSSFGTSLERLLREAPLATPLPVPTPSPAELECTADEFAALLQTAIQLTGHRALALHTGLQIPLTRRSAFSYALLHCNNLEQALDMTLHLYEPLIGRAQSSRQGNLLLVSFSRPASLQLKRLSSEWFYSGLVSVLKHCSGRPLTGVQLQLDYPAPTYRAAYQSLLDCSVSFDASYSRLCIPVDLLQRPPQLGAAILPIYQQQCEAIERHLAQHSTNIAPGSLSARVRSHLIYSTRFPTLEECASQLLMSARTFRRHLQKEGNSYQQVLDQVRLGLAGIYLRHAAISVRHTASLLGFHDTANFRRAFIGWSGQSPASYRRQQQAG